MIDPKFNELPVEGEIEGIKIKEDAGELPSRGLSINETIAVEANKSVGARGTNTSGVSAGLEAQDPSGRLDIEPVSFPFTQEELALRAFECWQERGCPVGSPDIDWKQAEQDLLLRSRGSKASVATA